MNSSERKIQILIYIYIRDGISPPPIRFINSRGPKGVASIRPPRSEMAARLQRRTMMSRTHRFISGSTAINSRAVATVSYTTAATAGTTNPNPFPSDITSIQPANRLLLFSPPAHQRFQPGRLVYCNILPSAPLTLSGQLKRPKYRRNFPSVRHFQYPSFPLVLLRVYRFSVVIVKIEKIQKNI